MWGLTSGHFVFVCVWVCEERERVQVFKSVHLCVNGSACLWSSVCLCVHQRLKQWGMGCKVKEEDGKMQ